MNIKETFKAPFADGVTFLSELFYNDKQNYTVKAVVSLVLSAIFLNRAMLHLGKIAMLVEC